MGFRLAWLGLALLVEGGERASRLDVCVIRE